MSMDTTFDRALALVLNRRLREHEAGHAASALLLGLDVKSVRAGFYDHAALSDADPEQAAGEADVEGTDRRALLISALCGPLAAGEVYWPPAFPPSLAPITSDEEVVGDCVRELDLDEDEYGACVDEARALIASPRFKSLHSRIADALATPPYQIGPAELHHLQQLARKDSAVQNITFKAALAATTDLGEFEAVISTEGSDRERDIVSADAMVKALSAWNRPIPLLWNHSGAAEDVIGTIDPATVEARDGEVIATGRVDLESTRGRDAWRSVKSRSAGFSFGYMVTSSSDRVGGGRIITGLDVFEISITPTPMNNDTRVLQAKAADTLEDTAHVHEQARAAMVATLTAGMKGTTSTPAPESTAELRKRALAVAEEVKRATAPTQVAVFEC